MTAGYQICQVAHALTEFIFKFPFLSYYWRKKSNYLAVLSVQQEAGLLSLWHQLEAQKIRHTIFKEPDIGGQITAIAIEPSETSRKLCAGIPLALKNISNGINKHNFKNKNNKTNMRACLGAV